MNKNKINHNALSHLVDASAITSITAFAKGDTWTLNVQVGENKKVLMAKNSGKPRIWRKLDTLAQYLQKMGLDSFEINITNYKPEQKSLRRPDSAAALRKTHQAQKAKTIEGTLTKPRISKDKKSSSSIKEKWEERRARILAEENPRV